MSNGISRRARRLGPGVAALATVAIALAGGAAGARAAVPATVSVAANTVTRPVAPDFLGLALEFSTVPQWAGGGGPPAVLVNLIRNLTPNGHPSVRIGGLSTDRTWWPAPGVRRPAGVTYALGPGWAETVTALARALNARLILGVNFEANDRGLAAAEARAFRATIPGRYLSAIDLGNEMPLYTSVPWYRVSGGTLLPWYATGGQAVFSRSPSWGPIPFVRDYTRVLGALPPIPVAGPDTQNIAFFGAYDRLLSPHSRVRMLTSHGYGLNTCVTNAHVPTYPTIAHLLTRYALDDLLAGLSPSIALAHRNRASFRIDEMGSVTCGGRPGVSDTMASALWAAQALFTVARAGVDGVNLHTYPGLPNALYDLNGPPGARTATVHPLYYGALLFARAAPAGSRLAAISTRGPLTLRAWATAGPGRARHVLLVNASPNQAAAVTLNLPRGAFASGSGQLQRLTAPDVRSRDGITLGGRSFGPVTATGTLAAPRANPVSPRGHGYRVWVPAGSAALLTLMGPPTG
ncbi:MAG TPA: glycosyl hydrolase family 79 C-terminal domain-containing protein [Solirubrobacteraceae bacterium]|nr:glycosyl hydrolase family 79 C-terminal domain-containing protein [Solirubrobacteraceae bacterium]